VRDIERVFLTSVCALSVRAVVCPLNLVLLECMGQRLCVLLPRTHESKVRARAPSGTYSTFSLFSLSQVYRCDRTLLLAVSLILFCDTDMNTCYLLPSHTDSFAAPRTLGSPWFSKTSFKDGYVR
jgi:hypothetical protein